MLRKAIFFKLRPGQRDEYKRRHDDLWPELAAELKRAGVSNYSIWFHDDLLFAYLQVEDPQRMSEVLDSSEVYLRWRRYMEDIIDIAPSGQKEWPMELMFLLE